MRDLLTISHQEKLCRVIIELPVVADNFLLSIVTGADPGGAGARTPPLILGFEAPKLSIFGPYLIYLQLFCPRFARHIISFFLPRYIGNFRPRKLGPLDQILDPHLGKHTSL